MQLTRRRLALVVARNRLVLQFFRALHELTEKDQIVDCPGHGIKFLEHHLARPRAGNAKLANVDDFIVI